MSVERRVEPEPSLGWKAHLHSDVGDEKVVLELLSERLEAETLPNGRSRAAVARHHKVTHETVVALRRMECENNPVRAHGDIRYSVLPSEVDEGHPSGAIDQKSLHVVLLKIDERRTLVTGLRPNIKLIQQLIAQKHFPDVPRNAFGHHGVRTAEAVEYFERALRNADRS